jgi:putative Ca2+/H+ antiporter (TMEM165/GDT1 family)
LLGALAGGSLAQLVPTEVLQLAAALGFVVIGGRLVWGALRQAGQTNEPPAP